MLVHLPIGGLILLGILELLAKVPRFKDAARNNGLILGLTAVASVATASALSFLHAASTSSSTNDVFIGSRYHLFTKR